MNKISSKNLTYIIPLIMVFNSMSLFASGDSISINGVQFNQPVQTVNNIIIAPIWQIAEMAGVERRWNEDRETITLLYRNSGVAITVGSPNMSVLNVSEPDTLPVRPTIRNVPVSASVEQRISAPVEPIFRRLGLNVRWDGRILVITTPGFIPQVPRNLRSGTPGIDNVRLSWDSVGYGVRYKLYWNTQNNSNTATALDNPSLENSMNISAMTSGANYFFGYQHY